MKSRTTVSRRQLLALAFTGFLAPTIRLIPPLPSNLAGSAAWLTPVMALPFCLIYYRILGDYCSHRRAGESMSDLLSASFGKLLGGAAAVLVALWLTFYGGFTMRTASERLLSAVYNAGNTWLLSAVTITMSYIGGRGSLRALARSAEIFAGMVLLILIPLLFFSATEIHTDYLLPVVISDVPKILLGAVPVVNVMSCYGYFTFLYGGVERRPTDEGLTLRGCLITLTVIFAVMLCTVGNLSAPLCAKLQNPFFIMIRGVTMFGVIERIEALVLGVWVITDFLFLSAQLMIASTILTRVVGLLKREHWCLIIAIASYGVSFLVGTSAFDLVKLSVRIVPGINMALMLVLLRLGWVIWKIKRHYMKGRPEQEGA